MSDAAEHSDSPAAKAAAVSRRRFLGWVGIGLAALAIPRPLWAVTDPQVSYSETIAVLKLLYSGEVESGLRYNAFEARALKDGHVNIAHMFAAIAASEAVHARHFSELLVRMGIEVEPPDAIAAQLDLSAGTTKENLRYATNVELAEIDTRYPQYLRRIKSEQHTSAVKHITYAWKAEQQHRQLIKDIQSGTGIFFGMLLERFRSTTTRYFVCQNCGSTLTALPSQRCPICAFPLSWYKEIPLPAA